MNSCKECSSKVVIGEHDDINCLCKCHLCGICGKYTEHRNMYNCQKCFAIYDLNYKNENGELVPYIN